MTWGSRTNPLRASSRPWALAVRRSASPLSSSRMLPIRPGPRGSRSWAVRWRARGGPDPDLGEHVAQMPLNGPRTEEEPRTDLRIRQAIAGQACDLSLLRGQVVAGLDRPLAHLLACRLKLIACALGEPLHPDRDEHLVGAAQLLARVDPAVLAAQPLAVEQMRRASSDASRVRLNRSIASRCRRSALSPSLTSARQRAWIPRLQSVLQGAVAEITRSSAPDATSGLAERTAASTSSVDAQGENWSSVSRRPRVGPRRAPS